MDLSICLQLNLNHACLEESHDGQSLKQECYFLSKVGSSFVHICWVLVLDQSLDLLQWCNSSNEKDPSWDDQSFNLQHSVWLYFSSLDCGDWHLNNHDPTLVWSDFCEGCFWRHDQVRTEKLWKSIQLSRFPKCWRYWLDPHGRETDLRVIWILSDDREKLNLSISREQSQETGNLTFFKFRRKEVPVRQNHFQLALLWSSFPQQVYGQVSVYSIHKLNIQRAALEIEGVPGWRLLQEVCRPGILVRCFWTRVSLSTA